MSPARHDDPLVNWVTEHPRSIKYLMLVATANLLLSILDAAHLL